MYEPNLLLQSVVLQSLKCSYHQENNSHVKMKFVLKHLHTVWKERTDDDDEIPSKHFE